MEIEQGSAVLLDNVLLEGEKLYTNMSVTTFLYYFLSKCPQMDDEKRGVFLILSSTDIYYPNLLSSYFYFCSGGVDGFFFCSSVVLTAKHVFKSRLSAFDLILLCQSNSNVSSALTM